MKKFFAKSLIALPVAAALMSGCTGGATGTANVDTSCKASNSNAVLATTTTTFNEDAWKNAACTQVALYPQQTMGTNDKAVNAAMKDAKMVTANVKALTNGEQIALRVIWPDASDSKQGSFSSQTYADGFALQFAQNDSTDLPYIGMGSNDRPVVIYLQKNDITTYEPNGNYDHKQQRGDQSKNMFDYELKAYNQDVSDNGHSDYQKAFISEGVRSMTEVRSANKSFNMEMVHTGSHWVGTFVKDVRDDLLNMERAEVPMTLALWDGDKLNRDGQKHLSTWVSVQTGSEVGEVSKAINWVSEGDANRGKQLATNNCAPCHNYADMDNGMPYMAPNLSQIGGQSTASYIKESIVAPDAALVPGYNRNAHPKYAWYNVVDGKRMSAMPSFSWMEAKDIDDIVAYFQSLKK
jgi:complex iron-sulfur molybdoenzyme family reductase subunit gamma